MSVFDEESTDEQPRLERRARILSLNNSIKQDLQEIFEMQKEIGAAVYSLHKVAASYNLLLTKHDEIIQGALDDAQEEYKEQLQIIKSRLDDLQKSIVDKTDSLSSNMSGKMRSVSEVQDLINKDWIRIKKVMDIVLKNNGYDPVTLAEHPESVKKLNWLFDKFSSVIVSLIISGLLSLLMIGQNRSSESKMLEISTKTIQTLETMQKELKAHIETEQSLPHYDEPRPKRW